MLFTPYGADKVKYINVSAALNTHDSNIHILHYTFRGDIHYKCTEVWWNQYIISIENTRTITIQCQVNVIIKFLIFSNKCSPKVPGL